MKQNTSVTARRDRWLFRFGLRIVYHFIEDGGLCPLVLLKMRFKNAALFFTDCKKILITFFGKASTAIVISGIRHEELMTCFVLPGITSAFKIIVICKSFAVAFIDQRAVRSHAAA